MIGVASKPTRRGLTWEKNCVGCMDVGGDCTCQFSIQRNKSNDLLSENNCIFVILIVEVFGTQARKLVKKSEFVEFRLHSRFVLGRWRYFAYFLYFLAILAVSHFYVEGWIDEVWIRAVDKGIITLGVIIHYFIIDRLFNSCIYYYRSGQRFVISLNLFISFYTSLHISIYNLYLEGWLDGELQISSWKRFYQQAWRLKGTQCSTKTKRSSSEFSGFL